MAISTLTNRAQYTANGVNVIFAFPYKFFQETNLEVYVDDVLKTLTTDYTVSGIPPGSFVGGGNVVFGAAPASLAVVTIVRKVPRIQPSDYQDYPNYAAAADVFENDLDRRAMCEQELADEISRVLQIPVTDPVGLDMTLPAQADRLNKFFAFDASGKPIAAVGMASVPVTSWAATLLDDSDLSTAQNTLGIDFILGTIKLLRGTVAGLTISNSGGDATNDIDIAAGWCLADGATDGITLGSALTKRKDAAWAVGTGNGGMDTGSAPADGFMYLWLIKRPDTGVVDALFSISATAPSMPANYTLKRRIGAVRTTTSAILAFEQNGDEFRFKAISTAFNLDVVGSTARQLLTVKVPPNMIGRFNVTASYATTGPGFAWVGSTAFTDVTPATYYSATMLAYLAGDETMEQEIPVDGSSRIAFRVSNATNSLFGCQVLGWIDRRGKQEAV